MKRLLLFLMPIFIFHSYLAVEDIRGGLIGDGQDIMSLEKAIAAALEHSYGVAGARFDSAAAHNEWNAARAGRYPTLSLSARSVYLSDLVEISLIPGMTRESGVKETWQADARLIMPLYTGGKLSSGIKAKKELARAGTYDLEAERMTLAYRTRTAYLAAFQAYFILRTAEASHSRIMTIRKDIQNLYEAGLADSLDILETELAFQKAAEEISRQTAVRDNSVRALAFLLGEISGLSSSLDQKIPEPDEKYDYYRAIRIPRDTVNRAELSALAARREAAGHAIAAAQASYFPELSVFTGYSAGKPNRDFFAAEQDDYFSVGLNLNWMFNFGNGTGREVAAARYKARATAEVYEELKETLTLGADIAFRNLFQAYDVYKIVREEYTLAYNKYRLAKEKQKAGRLSVNRLLEINSELWAAEGMYNASLVNFYLAETEYLYAIGSPNIFGGY